MHADTRDRILEAVREHPGASVKAIAQKVGVDHSTADYHLHRLARAGSVRATRAGRLRAHYAAGAGVCPYLQAVAPLVPGAAERAALLHVATGAAEGARDLPHLTGLSVQQARWLLEKAREAGLVHRAGFGRWIVPPATQPCVPHLHDGTPCGRWGACPVSRGWPAS